MDQLSEQRKNNPKLLCILGSYYKDKTYFEKALEVSNNKSH